MPSTRREVLREAAARLAVASSCPEADAAELLSRRLGVGRGELLREGDATLAADVARDFAVWVARRLGGEPVQYITGRAAFRDLDLAVSPAVLVPRPETEELVEAVLQVLRAEQGRWPAPRVLELGTGSGAIALALAQEWPAATITATDVSTPALALARANAVACDLGGRVRFASGSWFEALDPEDRFEVVVSNPPYIAESERADLPADVRDHEPALALFAGPTGLEAIREIIETAPRHLVAGGLLALELSETRAREVAIWVEGGHDWEGVELRADLAGEPRILLARRQRGPAIAPAQWVEEQP